VHPQGGSNNVQLKVLACLHACGSKDGSNRPCSSTLLPDDLSKVARRDAELQDDACSTFDYVHFDLIEIVHRACAMSMMSVRTRWTVSPSGCDEELLIMSEAFPIDAL
jgi:hypothetical protein